MFDRIFRRGTSRRRSGGTTMGLGRGVGNKPGSGPQGYCTCPNCGFSAPHSIGQRCMDISCPLCGTKMIRE